MTSKEFRTIALSFPEVEEKSHFDHPDFRVAGKIFATLAYPRKGWGMVKLSPRDQKFFVESNTKIFSPANGQWGLKGATLVHLRNAGKNVVRTALIAAWRNRAPKALREQIDIQ